MKHILPGHSCPKICLDAGHYGKQNRSPGIPEYYESEMNWKLHGYLGRELEKLGMKVIYTREDQKKDRGLRDRGRASRDCDLFLSVHSNAAGSEMKESADRPVAIVPMSGKGDELGKILSETVRKTMQTKEPARVYSKESDKDPGKDWYGVLRGCDDVGTVGMILEHSFHTCTRSVRWLLEDSNLKAMAAAEAKALAEWFDMPEPEKKKYYRVQIGAYSVKENAERQLEKAKKAGFHDAYIKYS